MNIPEWPRLVGGVRPGVAVGSASPSSLRAVASPGAGTGVRWVGRFSIGIVVTRRLPHRLERDIQPRPGPQGCGALMNQDLETINGGCTGRLCRGDELRLGGP